MKAKIVLLPGDGIGPEVVGAAATFLDFVAERLTQEPQILQRLAGLNDAVLDACSITSSSVR